MVSTSERPVWGCSKYTSVRVYSSQAHFYDIIDGDDDDDGDGDDNEEGDEDSDDDVDSLANDRNLFERWHQHRGLIGIERCSKYPDGESD